MVTITVIKLVNIIKNQALNLSAIQSVDLIKVCMNTMVILSLNAPVIMILSDYSD